MNQSKLLLFALALLMIPVGVVAAQSSIDDGPGPSAVVGGASSSSPGFSVTAVVGQSIADIGTSASYKVSGGFLHPFWNRSIYRTWLPLVLR